MSWMLRKWGALCVLMLSASVAGAQTTTYHLHNEASSTSGLKQLKTSGPDVASAPLLTANLKSTATGEKLIKEFDTQAGVPGAAGVIPTGSTVTVQLWMKKTANVGTLFPRAKVRLDNAAGTLLCTATGATAITTTLTKYTITCNTTANITQTASTRLYVWAGANMTAGSTTTNFMAELDIEGALNGNFDSQIAIPNSVPAPTITPPLSPSSAGIGQSVTITGTNFGATQGTSTVKFFNNKTATATNWSPTSITATVPSGATTGNVTITVATQVSNGVSFTVLPTPTISTLSPSAANPGTLVTINGSNFGTTQGSSTVTFNGVLATSFTSWISTQIRVTAPAGTTTGPVVVTVNGVPSAGKTFTIPPVLSSIAPSSAHIGEPVVVTGASFLATQGTNTVKFNGTTGVPTVWSDTSITVPLPAGATAGNVVVTINGSASNGLPFTVTPPPAISGASPGSTSVGESVWVSGTNFGATQGTSTIKFNGITSTPTSWWDTGIIAPVPSGATTGNIVVTVLGQASSGFAFTVAAPGSISGTISRVTGGTGISGATVQAVQTGTIKGSASTSGSGTYSIASLAPGSYDVRVSAAGFSSELRQGITVTSSGASTVNVGMFAPGSVTGKVTQADGTTPISGAAVAIYAGASQLGTATTNGTGDYNINNLHPGSLAARATFVGYQTSEQATAVSESTAATRNFSLTGMPAGSVQYFYDVLGRLIEVTDQGGSTAIYRYDAVGNVVAIERPTSGAVAISGFTPTSGPIGAGVTVFGSGFSATPSQNTVTFNGVAAAVSSATTTQIVVSVPSGATTGAVAVTAPGGSATSGSPFTVTAGSGGAPAITEFTPSIGVPGTAVTITGTNFGSTPANDVTRFNATVAALTSVTNTVIDTTVPVSAGSGRVSVTTPSGTATSAADFFVPPPSNTAADVEFTGRMTFATSTPVAISTSGKIGLLLFEGNAGQRLSLHAPTSTFGALNLGLGIRGPFNVSVKDVTFISANGLIEPVTLPVTGTYTIVVDPFFTATGNATVVLYSVMDVSGTISPNGTMSTMSITTPGQNGTYTFSGTAGQRVALDAVNSTIPGCPEVSIKAPLPDETVLGTPACVFGGRFLNPVTLPAAGNYRIFVNPAGANIGDQPLTLYDVPADIVGSIAPGGAPVNVTVAVPGHNPTLTFNGTVSQRIAVGFSNGVWTGFAPAAGGLLVAPDDSVIAATNSFPLTFMEPVTLPTAGVYRVVVDPNLTTMGSVTVTTYDVPADVTGSLTINATASPFTLTVPGQGAHFTFSGTQSQTIRAVLTQPSATCAYLQLFRADQTTFVQSTFDCATTIALPSTVLPATETYHLIVDPVGPVTGSFTISVPSP